MVLETWNNIDLDDKNKMVRFKKKLQILKKEIRSWVNDCKKNQSGRLVDLRSKLCHIDKVIDQGGVNDDILLTQLDLLKKYMILCLPTLRTNMQKDFKIQWAIEAMKNLKLEHVEIRSPRDEVRMSVWGGGENKSPGPRLVHFEFFQSSGTLRI
ncbi:hypothetical protein Tco_0143532 [Tanacetum coccineum]